MDEGDTHGAIEIDIMRRVNMIKSTLPRLCKLDERGKSWELLDKGSSGGIEHWLPHHVAARIGHRRGDLRQRKTRSADWLEMGSPL